MAFENELKAGDFNSHLSIRHAQPLDEVHVRATPFIIKEESNTLKSTQEREELGRITTNPISKADKAADQPSERSWFFARHYSNNVRSNVWTRRNEFELTLLNTQHS